jgi:hypothetical protein
MPVARIYTRVPEESTALVERLRARGYTVEVVDPGDFRVTPADLEIRLDRMKTEEAFAAAAEFGRKQRSEQNGVEIFVAKGVPVDEAAVRAAASGAAQRGNIVLEGLKAIIAPFRRAGREVHMSRAARRQQNIEREAATEAARKQRWEAKAAARAERERQDEMARAEREQQEAAVRVERERREAVAQTEREQRQREEEVRLAAEREATLEREREADARRQEEEALRRAERAAILAREREEEAQAERERQEAARRMEAEAEQRRQHAEAAERLAVEQQAAAQAERERQAVEAPMAAVAAEHAVRSREVAAPRPRVAPARYAPRERDGSRAMKRAFVAAACLAILAAVGWGAYENRTPASPLSNSDRVRGTAIQQDVPFGSARINGQTPQKRQTTTAPAAAKPVQSTQATQKPAASKAASKPAASTPKRTRHFANSDVDMVAEDQVIYHGAPKKSTSRAATQQQPNGVKKISDMD